MTALIKPVETTAEDKDAAELKAPLQKPQTPPQTDWSAYAREQSRRLLRYMVAFVGIPVLAASIYFGLIVADQFETEMHISVRSANQSAAPSLLGSFMMGVSNVSQSTQDVKSVADYIQSHDAVEQLQKELDLKSLLGSSHGDLFTRLPKEASFEKLVERYKEAIDVVFDVETGGADIRVRAYTAEDSKKLADAILMLSEKAVNGFNRRSQEDALGLAREELANAEERLRKAREALSAFKLANGDFDPGLRSQSISKIIAEMEAEYSKESARVKDMSAYMSSTSPALVSAKRKLRAIELQMKQEQGKLTGKGEAYVNRLMTYEPLVLEHEIAQQAYTSALASMESARIDAQRQHSYIVPIVRPYQPETASYPHRLKSVAEVFLMSLLVFGIGRLIIAGIRDHIMA